MMKRILFPFDVPDSSGNSITVWEGLDALAMASKLALMAKAEVVVDQSTPTLLDRRSLPPLSIDTSFLSSETPDLPIPSHMRGMAIENYDQTEHTYQKLPVRNNIKSKHGGKRGRTISDVYPTVRRIEPKHKLTHWDPSFLLRHNPDQFAARNAVQQLSNLAIKLESMDFYDKCVPSYQAMKERLLVESRFIGKCNDSHHEKGKCFQELYSTTIQQMTGLITMATKMDEGAHPESTRNEEHIDTSPRRESNSSTQDDEVVHIVTGEYSKRDFTEFMNNWLKDNWTNPYPDDEGLAEMAAINGTSPTIVSNWLINARTRKWRPAIVKAFNAGGPADTLMEESIAIFECQTMQLKDLVQPEIA